MTTADSYAASALSHETPSELTRLRRLEAMWDPASIAALDRVAVPSDGQVLELGAGAGSIARRLAREVPDGRVVATDTDTAFLPTDVRNLQPLRHDVRRDDFPDAAFDLIHARALFEHLPDAEAALARVTRWLKPGGVLMVEEIDGSPGSTGPHPELRRTGHAIARALDLEVGTDHGLGRRMPTVLAELGLTDVEARYEAVPIGDGGAGEQFLRSTLRQLGPAIVAHGLLTEEDIDAFHAWLATPGVIDVALLLTCAWGTRPQAA